MKKISAFTTILLITAMLLGMVTGCADSGKPTTAQTKPSAVDTLPSTAVPTVPVATTQPTVPTEPVAPTQPTDVFPEELKGNVYLGWKDVGFCEKMTGKMMITIVFLSDTVSKWNQSGIDAAKASFDKELPKLETEAAQYGASLDVQITYLESKIGMAYDENDPKMMWLMYAMMEHGLNRALNSPDYLESHYQVDSAPVVFVLNQEGRAYARNSGGDSRFEYVVMFSSELKALRHELCHIYGAVDFYLPQETMDAAEQYLSNSIMLNGTTGIVDGFTAYLIGWTDKLTEEAEAFLRATNHITPEYLNQAMQGDQLTGYGTKVFENAVYVGYMVKGVPHGEGTCTWNDGGVYVGNWDNGFRNGYGEMTEANGSVYKGEWKNGKYHGKGTLIYAGGKQSYTGDWVNNVMQGKGKFVWATGEVYEGDWTNNLQNGQGTITWTDGSSYTGAWVKGKRTGYGVMTYASGDRYEGEFMNGKRTGTGTLYYADGSSVTGTWLNNELVEETPEQP